VCRANGQDEGVVTQVSQRQLAGERRNEERTRRQVRRTPGVVLGLICVLTLAVGVTAAIDLRRLDSPEGAAQAWVQAVLVGDCKRYLLLSVAPTAEVAADDSVCERLRESSRAGLDEATRTRVRVEQRADRAGPVARVVVELQVDGEPVVSRRLLLRDADRWRVVRDDDACALVRCP
jgi:hypothetical protein